jgi:putative tryptophan/tyrosine transport system substrate-binding protein
MRTNVMLLTLSALLLALSVSAQAQQPGKVYRVGYLYTGSTTTIPAQAHEAYRQGLRDLGWIEGQNIVIEYRFADVHYI